MTKNKFEVKTSRLDGRGVFATRNIGKGDRIGRWVGKRVKRTSSKYSISLPFNGEDRLYLATGLLKYLNHRDSPNSDFEGFELFATKSIKKGQEITIHYGNEYVWDDDNKMVK